MKNYNLQEVEHENLILGQELISLYKKRIAELEEENKELKLQLTQVPVINPNPTPNRRKVATITELRELLENRSSKLVAKFGG